MFYRHGSYGAGNMAYSFVPRMDRSGIFEITQEQTRAQISTLITHTVWDFRSARFRKLNFELNQNFIYKTLIKMRKDQNQNEKTVLNCQVFLFQQTLREEFYFCRVGK